ncbi:cob(I)yrinic acid a,c-diamide adenosyltransferase [Clostridiaceae bacterium Marseille-Q4143]|nr:cob(I)yrinic acid a,c-diamide adenosyltransferase [Clostridiaceae bacterium Marseille-Q4143]
MKEGKLQIYCGNGKGKTTAAIGQAIREASKGRSVFIVQFLKGKQEEISFIKRLEPEIKLFRFQKREEAFENLTEQEKEEEIPNLKNGLNFARKVLATGECDVLILDEVLGLPEREIATLEELHSLLEAAENTDLIFTGIRLYPEMLEWADEVYEISVLKGSE